MSAEYMCDLSLFVGPYCSEFQCENDKCIDSSLVCDRIDHCFDNSDEDKNCGSKLVLSFVISFLLCR